jgi:hypothetical protein
MTVGMVSQGNVVIAESQVLRVLKGHRDHRVYQESQALQVHLGVSTTLTKPGHLNNEDGFKAESLYRITDV